jgi:hypothetical protein
MQSDSEAQLDLQALPPQTYGSHGMVTAPGQVPAPSQVAAAVAIPPEQLAPRQLVLMSGYAQADAFAPSHVPPQAPPAPVQAVRGPRGVPLTATHCPTLPATSHASHWPPQAWLQQTLSAQLPFPHWFEAEQAMPSAFLGTHAPAPLQ